MPDETNSPLSQASTTEPALNQMRLADALARLDPKNDADWTADGKPRIEALSALTGATVTRADVDALAPDFSREAASEPDEPAAESAAKEPAALSVEDRLARLEDDHAFLRATFGWPNKT